MMKKRKAMLLLCFVWMSIFLVGDFLYAEEILLKDSQAVEGEVIEGSFTEDGFLFIIEETGEEHSVSWGHLDDAFAVELRKKYKFVLEADRLSGNLFEIEGVEIILKGSLAKIQRGVLLSEDDESLQLKTAERVLRVDKSKIAARKSVLVDARTVYSIDELYAEQFKKHAPEDLEGQLKMFSYSLKIEHFARARYHIDLIKSEFAEEYEKEENKESIDRLFTAMELAEEKFITKRVHAKLKVHQFLEADEICNAYYKIFESDVMHGRLDLLKKLIEKNKRQYLQEQMARMYYEELKRQIDLKLEKKDLSLKSAKIFMNNSVEKLILREIAESHDLDEGSVYEIFAQRNVKNFKEKASYGEGTGFAKSGADLKAASKWWNSLSKKKKKQWLIAYYADTVMETKEKSVKKKNCKNCKGDGSIKVEVNGTKRKQDCPNCAGSGKQDTVSFR